jgi:hypothetical protein
MNTLSARIARPIAAAAILGIGAMLAPSGAIAHPTPQVRPALTTHHDPAVPRPSGRRADPRAGSPWVPLVNPAPFNPGAMLLLTDGTVLVQDQGPANSGSGNWWRLTPDAAGSYVDGTWSQVASLPSGYTPYAFASAVLPDGRVIIEGGEEDGGQYVWTNQGAIYDPVANTWTSVSPPSGGRGEWSRIGDAPSSVLSNGRFMLGASGFSGTTVQATLDASTLTWKPTGTSKADGNGEEGWSLLPSGKLLTVDTTDSNPASNSEIYSPTTGAWTSAGATPVPLVDADGETGPQIIMPNGSVLAVGATGDNAIYNTKTGVWSTAPSFPVIGGGQFDVADGPAAVLPDGNVLLDASHGEYQTPAHFFVYNPTRNSLTRVADAPNAANQSSYFGYMLVLPTGQILFNDRIGDMDVFVAGGTARSSWAPTITSVPSTLSPGGTATLQGRQLNGLSQGAAYGDDFQDATNYPLVRITNQATGAVTYARTFGMTSMSVTPKKASSVQFTLPAGIATGPSTLVVVADGIASLPVAVTITSGT